MNSFTARTLIEQEPNYSYVTARLLQDELRAEGHPVLKQTLGSSVKVKESHEQHVPLIWHDRGHRITQDYVALFKALKR